MLTMNAECTDCHNIANPSGTHLDGVLNSVELKQNINGNTAHLNTSWIGASSPDYSVQLTLDNACALQCHSSSGRHRHSNQETDPAYGVVRFGRKGSVLDGQAIAYPIDVYISTNAPSAPADGTANFDYAPCISCHNPHGTNIVEPSKDTNRMLRDLWVDPETLCLKCHK
jgi:predicted CXXCH cytochrome family protein